LGGNPEWKNRHDGPVQVTPSNLTSACSGRRFAPPLIPGVGQTSRSSSYTQRL
jgi:hypothetical protein